MKIDTNSAAERDEIVFGRRLDWSDNHHGLVHLALWDEADGDPITPATARELVDHDYLDPESSQNFSPTAEELIEFAEYVDDQFDGHEAGLIGYVISPHRDDTRITLTGFIVEIDDDVDLDPMLREAIHHEFSADEQFVGTEFVRYWWD